MANRKHSAPEIVKAIKGSGGIKATIARKLRVHRHTVDNYLDEFATARRAYDDEVAVIGDMAETVIIKSIKNEDVATAKWYASNKLKDRGYAERREIGHDGKLQIEYVNDWRQAEN